MKIETSGSGAPAQDAPGEEYCGSNACVGTMLVRSAESGNAFVAVYDTKRVEHVQAAAEQPPISSERAQLLGMLCFRTGDEWPKFVGEVQAGEHQYPVAGEAGRVPAAA